MFRANEDSEKLRAKAFDYLLMKESFPGFEVQRNGNVR